MMERKTMGAFIAALRKARGMTQQEVADRLNVSNKTISKWERDEGYPEITIIPALAELFKVTSDEILRGERIPRREENPGKQAARVERQIRQIVNSTMTRFQNFSCLAAALALSGWVILFTIAYTFYRPLLGFGIMAIFVLAGVTMEVFLINTVRAATGNREITGGNAKLLTQLRKTINRYAFAVFMINIAVFILSLPFILFRDSCYVESVISLETYLAWLPGLLIIIALVCALLISLFRERLFLEKRSWPGGYPVREMRRLNLIQGVTLLLAGTPVVAGAFLQSGSYPLIICFFAMFLFAVAGMIVIVVKSKAGMRRLLLLAAGIRNILYLFVLTYLTTWLTIVTTADGERFHHLYFTPGPPLLFLGATAGYLFARHYIWKGSCRLYASERVRKTAE